MSRIDRETGEEIPARKKVQGLNDLGREIPDRTPMAPPIGYKKEPSLRDQIRQMVLSEKLRMEAEAAGFETPEEADDFEVGEDFDPSSPYEHNFDPPAEVVPPVRPEVVEAEKRAVQASEGSGGPDVPEEPSDASLEAKPKGKPPRKGA